jgi:hypothetical protein
MFRRFLASFLFLYLASLPLTATSPTLRYGILEVDFSFFPEPEKVKIEILHFEPNVETSLLTYTNVQSSIDRFAIKEIHSGKNILPVGTYFLKISCAGYVSSSSGEVVNPENILTLGPGDAKNYRPELIPIASQLKIISKVAPFDLYYQQKKILHYEETNRSKVFSEIILDQFPSGQQQLLLLTSNQYAFVQIDAPRGKRIETRPIFAEWKSQIIWCGILGLIPGANYFLHFPEAGVGPMIATTFFFHFGLTAVILSQTGNLQYLAPDRAPIASEILIGGLVILSVLHAVLSYSGAYIDVLEKIEKASTIRIQF